MMKLGVFFVLSFGCGPAVAGICPPDWPLFERKCYYALKESFSWEDGRTACEKLEAYLAVASSNSENTFIWELFSGTFDQNPKFGLWTGYIYIDENWQPYRRDGDNYNNWGYNQPNDENGNCSAMSLESGGVWGTQLCSNLRGVVCERPPSSGPQVICFHSDENGRLTSQGCIKNHVVRELRLRVGGVVSCGMACRAEHRCRSFNLLEQGGGEMVCQLNNATRHEAADGNMKARDTCYFFDL